MKRLILIFITVFSLPAAALPVSAAETACAKVTMEILQELTLERVAFDAKLVITNNLDIPIENIRVDVVIKDKDGNIKDSLFFVRKPVLTGISGIDGTGTVGSAGKGEAHWLIVPAAGAGVVKDASNAVTQISVDYFVGATLTYTVGGTQEVVPIYPAKITVKPMPELVLDYFMPYQVIGDNPFTPQVEPPVSYPLAVRVMNDGYGSAMKLKISSAQPKIVDNVQELLIGFHMLGTSVNDSPVTPSLTVDFGDVASKKGATASWRMISTLSGKFKSFTATFTHASELGGELTSLIRETNARYLTKMVKVNLPGRDNRLDFLADTNNDGAHLPDAIFESEIPAGGTSMAAAQSPVSIANPLNVPTRPTPDAPTVKVTLQPTATGWIYTNFDDPSKGLLELKDVVRNDGIHLDPNNFWVEHGLDQNFQKTYKLQFIDHRTDLNATEYTLVFDRPAVDTTPPVTEIVFNGPVTGETTKFITPATQIIFTATDNTGGSGVEGMYWRYTGSNNEFLPAYPFTLAASATPYSIDYYSADRAGNVETTKTLVLKVDSDAPTISSFTATPTTFIPQAPKGIAASSTVSFSITATDDLATLPATIDIIGADGKIVRTLTGTVQSGTPLIISWDGKDSQGAPVATGDYTARLVVTDGLNNLADPADRSHSATLDIQVKAEEWFAGQAVDRNSAPQLHPKASGSKVVWQDQRNGAWDIYLKDTASTAASVRITSDPASQERPAIDGNTMVWQDNRGGNWDIYAYDLTSGQEFIVYSGAGDQERPVVSGNWIAWQDNRSGNWDIYAKNLTSGEILQVTNHERDQLHPALSGTILVWEDYRHGLGEVYSVDLSASPLAEQRGTVDSFNQTAPAIFGGTIVWVDDRNGQKDIYRYDPLKQALRITYGAGDHIQAAVLGSMLVYTDYEAGLTDPNLSFLDLSSGAGGRLTSHTGRQEEPTLGDDRVFWQDDKDGPYQIYTAQLTVEPLPIEVELKPGFNLVAVGQWLKNNYPNAAALLADVRIDKVLAHENLHNTYTEASATGGDFSLAKGMGLVIYAKSAGTLKIAESGETVTYNLLPGTNQIGLLAVPYGYTAYDLMKSVGLDNIESVRRFDTATGEWETVVVRTTASGPQMVGINFSIHSGDGLVITMKNRVDWTP